MKVFCKLAPALCALLVLQSAQAREQVALEELGELELHFVVATAVARVPGASVWAQVSHRAGEAFRVYAPQRIQQAHYLVEAGQRVAEGQPVVELSGPEIHHWQLEFESVEARYRLAQDRYRRNESLYARQSIPESRWLEIVSQWHALRLEFEHMSHFAELLAPPGDSVHESLTLLAPFDALVDYVQSGAAPLQDELIAAFVPRDALRLRARVPAARRDSLEALDARGCEVPVATVSEQVDGFLVDAWSTAPDASCGFLPGQTLEVTPLYRAGGQGQRVLRVPGSALLAWEQQNYLLQRRGEVLVLQPVTPLTREGADYLVRAPSSLAGAEVLADSVSAVQGILLGLGVE